MRWTWYLAAAVLALNVTLGVSPRADRLTWALENAPVWIGLVVLYGTRRQFPLTPMVYLLLAIHAVILMIGGYYTYAKVPLGDWMRDAFGLARNHYDRVGHFAQGFIPALLVREVLIRLARLPRNYWLFFLVACVCLSVSASYEFFEWWVAVATGQAAEAFLGTQGDPWDTQWDMFLCLVGALAGLLCLSRIHNRQLDQLVTATTASEHGNTD